MRDLSGLARPRIDAAHRVDRVAKTAQVHELEAQREERRAEDEPDHHERDLDVGAPKGDVEEDHRFERCHDPVDEETVQPLDPAGARFHVAPLARVIGRPGGGPEPRVAVG